MIFFQQNEKKIIYEYKYCKLLGPLEMKNQKPVNKRNSRVFNKKSALHGQSPTIFPKVNQHCFINTPTPPSII